MSGLFVLRQQELHLREIKDQMRSCEEKETDNLVRIPYKNIE